MKNVLLLFGGKSFEHDISIITALIVQNRYNLGKYRLVPVYIDCNNEWFYFSGEKMISKMFANFKENSKRNGFFPAYLKTNKACLFYKRGIFEQKIDVYASINCCHGGMGEDGELSSVLNASNIPSSAGDHTALGICMDKILSKLCFDGLNIKCLKYFKVTKDMFESNIDCILKKASSIGYPLILKPATLGSSIGISVVKDKDELKKCLLVAFEFDNCVLVEKAILEHMTEYNIACMKKDNQILVSPIDVPVKTDEILSFKDKYVGDKSDNITKTGGKSACKNPEPNTCKGGNYLSEKKFNVVCEKTKKQLEDIAKFVYKELGLSGVCRIDFIVDKKDNIYLNEINAIPGSLGYYFFVPRTFSTMSEFVDCLIDEGVNDFQNKKQFKKEFLTNLFDAN